MTKLLCRLTGGHEFMEKDVQFFQYTATGDIGFEVTCSKCKSLVFSRSYPRREFIDALVDNYRETAHQVQS